MVESKVAIKKKAKKQKWEPKKKKFGAYNLVDAVLNGRTEEAKRLIMDRDATPDIDYKDTIVGIAPLHAAVATNNLAVVRLLVEERKASFFADKQGRWPSTLAIICQVSSELSDYIARAEAEALGIPYD